MPRSYNEDVREDIPGYVKLGIAIGVLLILGCVSIAWVVDTNDAGWVCVKQAAVTGELTVINQPGSFGQWFGDVTRYQQAVTIGFGSGGESGQPDMPAIDVRFADAGKAKVFGNARFELPVGNTDQMLTIHKQYRGFTPLVSTLLERVTAQVTVLTANMLTSEDTYTGGRGRFVEMALDQLKNGVYQSETKEIEVVDPITQERRRVRQVNPKIGKNGEYLRLENELAHYGIQVTQYIIDRDFDYEQGIVDQISKQRDALNQTNTARAEAQRAAQEAITAKAKGEADVATARYRQLVEKETATVQAEKEAEVARIKAEQDKTVAAVTKERASIAAQQAAEVAAIDAQTRLKVAELDRQAAEQTKLKEIALGEGEAQRRRAVLEADGALAAKLDAWLKANQAYAQAIGNYRGNLVPQVIMTGSGGGSSTVASGTQSSTQDLIDLLMVKTAKDLALDMSMPAPSRDK